MTVVFLLIAFLLILLNAFFVLAEFAVVKVRTTKIDMLIERGSLAAKLVKHIYNHLDEYLSVCQIGITFASIGLGFVGEPSFATLFFYLLAKVDIVDPKIIHSLAIAVAYFTVSFLHILLGELIPKSIAVRRAERIALFSAYPLRFFRLLFFIPLSLLAGCANAILHLMGISEKSYSESFTEDEIKIILKSSQSTGMVSFLRLLMMENILDLGDLKVKDAMKPKNIVKVLDTSLSWQENMNIIKEAKYSRYPVVDGNMSMPIGIVHVKDIILNGGVNSNSSDLKSIARTFVRISGDTSLEDLLVQFQQSRQHAAIVIDKKGKWIGFITLEDIVEEIIGSIEDEFEKDLFPFLSEIITRERILLDLKSNVFEDVVKEMIFSLKGENIGISCEKAVLEVLKREKMVDSYLCPNVALPHARIDGLKKTILVFGRASKGIDMPRRSEKVSLIFLVLTPLSLPLAQPRLISRIYGLISSEYVYERLYEAKTPQEVLDIIKTADAVSVS